MLRGTAVRLRYPVSSFLCACPRPLLSSRVSSSNSSLIHSKGCAANRAHPHGQEESCGAARWASKNANQVAADDPSYGGKQVIGMDGAVYNYILAHTREPETSPEQGQFLALLVRVMGAERCIEVGVYTGYSSLAVALALPEYGKLVACERDGNSLNMAKKYYEEAGVSHKVDIREGMALDSLKKLLDEEGSNSYDFAFLDADKRKYLKYYELLLQLIRIGGLVVIDNVLWHGRIVNPKYDGDKKTESMKKFNTFVLHDGRVDVSMGSTFGLGEVSLEKSKGSKHGA